MPLNTWWKVSGLDRWGVRYLGWGLGGDDHQCSSTSVRPLAQQRLIPEQDLGIYCYRRSRTYQHHHCHTSQFRRSKHASVRNGSHVPALDHKDNTI